MTRTNTLWTSSKTTHSLSTWLTLTLPKPATCMDSMSLSGTLLRRTNVSSTGPRHCQLARPTVKKENTTTFSIPAMSKTSFWHSSHLISTSTLEKAKRGACPRCSWWRPSTVSLQSFPSGTPKEATMLFLGPLKKIINSITTTSKEPSWPSLLMEMSSYNVFLPNCLMTKQKTNQFWNYKK